MERIILHCDMNAFYASVECRNDPSLRGKPLAVCGNTEERHGIVLAKSEPAKKYGIKTGDTVWEAKRKCPDLVVVEPHMSEYIKASKAARKIYDEYSDRIEPFGLDECFIDASGMEWMYGSGYDLAETLRNRIKNELGLTISVGVSFNKIFAKLGSDMKKPDAVTVITREDFKEKVWCLPASDLIYIGRATEKKLASYGIHTVGEVAAAGPDFLRRVFGKNGIALWRNACGENADPVMPGDWHPEIKSIGHGLTCTSDLTSFYEVERLIFFLTQEVSYKLMDKNLYASGLQVDVKDTDREVRSYQGSLPLCTQNAKTISDAAAELFKKRYPWHKSVRSVTVRVTALSRECLPAQTSMFMDLRAYDKAVGAEKAAMAVKKKFSKWAIYPASILEIQKLPSGSFEEKVIFPESAVQLLNAR